MRRSPVRIALICAAALAAAVPVAASLPPHDGAPRESRQLPDLLVERAQKALSRLGLYVGPEDGRLDAATRAAVRIYRRNNNLGDGDGVDIDLIGNLEYAVGVRRLMRQLDAARAESIKQARSKLLEHPATRELIEGGGAAIDQTADPTRDPGPCFDQPTALCLLGEALESAKAIARPELRNWALGEILIAEARAGLGERAMQTAARISDPRLVIIALRDIAEAQAASGHRDQAMAAAGIIPDLERRADAFATIAEIQVRRGDSADAISTTEQLLTLLTEVPDALKRIAFRTRAAVILAGAEQSARAESELQIAENDARELPQDSSRSAGIRHVASALADMKETVRALEMLGGVSVPADRIPVLMTAAEAQARAGDAAAALATAESIEDVRYRAVVLGRIALAQAAAEHHDDAEATLQMALAAIERIERPFARSYAISRIALAMSQIGEPGAAGSDPDGRRLGFRKATETAKKIDDQRLKAHTLWLISERQRQAGDDAWQATEILADAATSDVFGDLSRVWMFADLAESQAIEGASDAAWRAFGRGIAIARHIDNSWSRARTLAKLAATLIRLVDPGRGQVPAEP